MPGARTSRPHSGATLNCLRVSQFFAFRAHCGRDVRAPGIDVASQNALGFFIEGEMSRDKACFQAHGSQFFRLD
jgi:hypothetical protein